MWSLNSVDGDELTIYELKTKNQMVGALTEIFFYANFMYDLCVKKYLILVVLLIKIIVIMIIYIYLQREM